MNQAIQKPEALTPEEMKARSSFNREALISISQGRLLGAEYGRLPAPDMLMMDRITHISDEGGAYGNGKILAELDINPDLWFFQCHFIDDPVMPGCLGLDAMWQLVGFYITWSLGRKGKGRALGVGEVKFFGQVLPTARLVRYEIDIKRVFNRKLAMTVADGRLLVDDREIYTAKGLKVGLFTSTDNF